MQRSIILIGLPLCLILLFIGIGEVDAQCVMCKAVAEKGADDGQQMAKGLNAGILWLMAVPYTLILTMALVFFRKRIKHFFRELKKA